MFTEVVFYEVDGTFADHYKYGAGMPIPTVGQSVIIGIRVGSITRRKCIVESVSLCYVGGEIQVMVKDYEQE